MIESKERGSATVEFVVFAVLLMVPLVYLVIAMGRVQAASFAADGSAREAARAFVTATDGTQARSRASMAVRLALRDQGFPAGAATLAIECQTATCLTPGSTITVRVEVRVALPGAPAILDRAIPAMVRVRASQVAVVDEFRAGGSG